MSSPTQQTGGPSPVLLNEKFRIQSYDGGAFKSKASYNIKNVLTPTYEPFHCSSGGSKYTLVVKYSGNNSTSSIDRSYNDYIGGGGGGQHSQICTVTNLVFSSNLKKCTDQLKSGLFWVLNEAPSVEKFAKYDRVPVEVLKKKFGGEVGERDYAGARAKKIARANRPVKEDADSGGKEKDGEGVEAGDGGPTEEKKDAQEVLSSQTANARSKSGTFSKASGHPPPPSSSAQQSSPSLVVPKIGFVVPPFGRPQEGAAGGGSSSSSSSAREKNDNNSAAASDGIPNNALMSGGGAGSASANESATGTCFGQESGMDAESEAELKKSSTDVEMMAAPPPAGTKEEEDFESLDEDLDISGPYYFETGAKNSDTPYECEIELNPWVEGKFVMVKFLDTHGEGGNIDVSVVGIYGLHGRQAAKRVGTVGKVWHGSCRKPVVHPVKLSSLFSSSGWVCDGRDFPGGCRSGQTDFNQTSVYTKTYRAVVTGVDLCEKCVKDPKLGEISKEIAKQDVEHLSAGALGNRGDFLISDIHLAKLAATRITVALRRNWRYTLPFYLDANVFDVMMRVLQKLDDISMALDDGNFRIVTASEDKKQKKDRSGSSSRAGAAAGAPASSGEDVNSRGGNLPGSSGDRRSSGRQYSAMEVHKRILRQCVHSLLVEMSHMAFFGYRGDLRPGDMVFYKNPAVKDQVSTPTNSSVIWLEGKFVGWSDDAETAVLEVNKGCSEKSEESKSPGSPSLGNAVAAATAALAGKATSLFRSATGTGAGGTTTTTTSNAAGGEQQPTSINVDPGYLWKKQSINPPVEHTAGPGGKAHEEKQRLTLAMADELCRGASCSLTRVKELIGSVDVTIANGRGCALLFLAVMHGCPIQVLETLINDAGATVEICGLRDGVSLFEMAQRTPHDYDTDALKLLDSQERRNNGHGFDLSVGKIADVVEEEEVLWGSSDNESLEEFYQLHGTTSGKGSGMDDEGVHAGAGEHLNPEENLSRIWAEGEDKNKNKKRKLNPDEENEGAGEKIPEKTKSKKMKSAKAKAPGVQQGSKKTTSKRTASKKAGSEEADEFRDKFTLQDGKLISDSKAKHQLNYYLALSPAGFREKFCAKVFPLIHSCCTAYPLVHGVHAPCSSKESGMMGGMSATLQAAEKLAQTVDKTYANTYAPRLAASATLGSQLEPASPKIVLNMIDQLPVEGMYALEPVLRSPDILYDVLSNSRTAYQSLCKILQSIVTTDSVEIAYHGCVFLNLLARHQDFCSTSSNEGASSSNDASKKKSMITPGGRTISSGVFCRLITSVGGLKWAERIRDSKLLGEASIGSSSALATLPTGPQPASEAASMLGFYRHTDLPGRKDTLANLRKEAEKLCTQLDKVVRGGVESSASGSAGSSSSSSAKNQNAVVTSADNMASDINPENNLRQHSTVSPFAKIPSLAQASPSEIYECLLDLRQLLNDTRSTSLMTQTSDTQQQPKICAATSFELASDCSIPAGLLELLQHNPEQNLVLFHDVFKNVEDFSKLTSFLHEVIDLGETFPVWRHKQERGLRALTDMFALRMARGGAQSAPSTGVGATTTTTSSSGGKSSGGPLSVNPSSPKTTSLAGTHPSSLLPVDPRLYLPDSLRTRDFFVTVEPLVTVHELSHYLQQITPISDVKYLQYCYELIGAVIQMPPSTTSTASATEFVVTDFSVFPGEIHLPVHTLMPLNADKEEYEVGSRFAFKEAGSSPEDGGKAKSKQTGIEEDSGSSSEPKLVVLNLRQYEVLSLPEKPHFEDKRVVEFLALLQVLKVSFSPRDYTDALMHLVDGTEMTAFENKNSSGGGTSSTPTTTTATTTTTSISMERKGSFGSLPGSPAAAEKKSKETTATTGEKENKDKTSKKSSFSVNDHQVRLMIKLQEYLLGGAGGGENAKMATSEILAKLRSKLIEELDTVRVFLEQRRGSSDSQIGKPKAKPNSGSQSVDPSQKCHVVNIVHTGGDDVPFSMIWEMLKDDITNAVRELCPRNSSLQSEEALNAGIANSGMGPIAKQLTLDEAERLAARVGNCVQTSVQVDHEELSKIREKEEAALQLSVQNASRRNAGQNVHSASAAHLSAGLRVQFSSKQIRSTTSSSSSSKNKDPYDSKGVILSRSSNLLSQTSESGSTPTTSEVTFDVVDDNGVLFECLPKARLKVSKSDLDRLNKTSSSSLDHSAGSHARMMESLGGIVRLSERLQVQAGAAAIASARGGAAGASSGASGAAGAASGLGDPAAGHGSRSLFAAGADPFGGTSAGKGGAVIFDSKGGAPGGSSGKGGGFRQFRIHKGDLRDLGGSGSLALKGKKGAGKDGKGDGGGKQGLFGHLSMSMMDVDGEQLLFMAPYKGGQDHVGGESSSLGSSARGKGSYGKYLGKMKDGAAGGKDSWEPWWAAGKKGKDGSYKGKAAAASSSANNDNGAGPSSARAANNEPSVASASFAEESVRPNNELSSSDAAAPAAENSSAAGGAAAANANDDSSGAAAANDDSSGAAAAEQAAPASASPSPGEQGASGAPSGASASAQPASGASASAAPPASGASAAAPPASGSAFDHDEQDWDAEEESHYEDDEYLDGFYGREEGDGGEDLGESDEGSVSMFESLVAGGRQDALLGEALAREAGSSGVSAREGAGVQGSSHQDQVLRQLKIMEEMLGGGGGPSRSGGGEGSGSGRYGGSFLSGPSGRGILNLLSSDRRRLLEDDLIFGGGPSYRGGGSSSSRAAYHAAAGSGLGIAGPGALSVELLKRVGELPMRANLPGFTRTTETTDSRSTLEHPVAERITQAELVAHLTNSKEQEANIEEDIEATSNSKPPGAFHPDSTKSAKNRLDKSQKTQKNTSGNNVIVDSELLNALDSEFREVRATFRLLGKNDTNVGGFAAFPLRWNLFKLFQRLSDAQHYQLLHDSQKQRASDNHNSSVQKNTDEFSAKVNGLRRVPLEDWALEFQMEVTCPDLSPVPRLIRECLVKASDEERKIFGTQLLKDLETEFEQQKQHPSKKRKKQICEKLNAEIGWVSGDCADRMVDVEDLDELNFDLSKEQMLTSQAVARDLYSTKNGIIPGGGASNQSLFGPEKHHPVLMETFCSGNSSVLDCLELLAMLKQSYLKAQYNPYPQITPEAEETLCQYNRDEDIDNNCAEGNNIEEQKTSRLQTRMAVNAPPHHNHAKFWENRKLDRKLRSQLDDPLSVITGSLPWWVQTLARICPFLFSLQTRKMLLRYTAFGQAYAIHWFQDAKLGPFLKRRQTLQTELNAAAMDPRKTQILSQELSNVEEHIIRSNWWLGSLQAALTKIAKDDQLVNVSSVAMEVLGRFPSCCRTLEVQFENETGFGQAVTQSFYVELANRLIERERNKAVPMWVEDDGAFLLGGKYGATVEHVGQMCRRGLLLRPLEDVGKEVLKQFEFFGRLVGKALREGFIVPVPLSEEFFALVQDMSVSSHSLPRPGTGYTGEFVGLMAEYVKDVSERTRGLNAEQKLDIMRTEASRKDFRARFLRSRDMDASPRKGPIDSTFGECSFSDYCSDLNACFLETGFNGAPLNPDGENLEVNFENVEAFVQEATDFWFKRGVEKQIRAFKQGFNDILPVQSLLSLSPRELMDMICGEDKIEWDKTQLQQHLHPSGTLSSEHQVYKFLVDILIEMEFKDRQRFLDFVTSCPRLPPGGMSKMHIEVCGVSGKRSKLPYSRACSSQLYLPTGMGGNTTKEELRNNLHEAMYSSVGSHEHR